MRVICIVAAICLSFAMPIPTDTGMVMGKIFDKTTKDMIPFVMITLEQEGVIKYKAETDFEGRYKIEKVLPGTYSVNLTVLDYNNKRISGFVVKSNVISFFDAEMERIKPLTKKELRKLEKEKRKGKN